MVHSIENESLKINIAEKGAELQNIINKKNSLEYLWQGDPQHWERRAPVLFPVVGKLKDNQYTLNGKTYEMGQHGFARNKDFKVISKNEDAVRFRMDMDDVVKSNYPFDFGLYINFQIVGNQVINEYQVINNGDKPMYFSIGGHPAFKCPLRAEENRYDYHLEFNKRENTDTHVIEEGLFTGEKVHILQDSYSIPIADDLFDNDALIFKDLESTKLSIVDPNWDKTVEMDFSGFPYLGIWSKSRKSPFVCLEPWYGIADRRDHDKDITKKEGIQVLEGNSSFKCHFTISIF
ncbi:MAG TPA: aldose 1-epimerase family protein [Cyclobacteriaceae bacterium]